MTFDRQIDLPILKLAAWGESVHGLEPSNNEFRQLIDTKPENRPLPTSWQKTVKSSFQSENFQIVRLVNFWVVDCRKIKSPTCLSKLPDSSFWKMKWKNGQE